MYTIQPLKAGGSLSVMAQMKDSTRSVHESLEHCVSVCLRDEDGYKTLLQRFIGIFRPLEAALPATHGLIHVVPDLPDRRRSGLLERDLAALGMTAAAIRNLPDSPFLPPVKTVAQALGCMYVLEGSTLGGQVIGRILGGVAPHARAFFTSDGRHVGPMWKRFGAALDDWAEEHPEQSDAICASAGETFRAMKSWLGQTGNAVNE